MLSTNSFTPPHPSLPSSSNSQYAVAPSSSTQQHQQQHQRRDSAVGISNASKITAAARANADDEKGDTYIAGAEETSPVSSSSAFASAPSPFMPMQSVTSASSGNAIPGSSNAGMPSAMAPLPRASMLQTMHSNSVAFTAAAAGYNKGANNQPAAIAANNAFIDANGSSRFNIATDAAIAAAAAAASAATATNTTSNSSPLVAPRPVSAHQMNPPSWLLAATLPLDILLGLAGTSYKQKIINDVFFTPEERHESPQLTPVSYIEDTRMRLLVPSHGLESLDPSADLALFADPQAADTRPEWAAADEIETISVCSSNTRQPSPTPTVISEHNGDDDLFSTIDITTPICGAITDCSVDSNGSTDAGKCSSTTLSSPLSAHVAQSKTQYSCNDPETASLSGESCVETSVPELAEVRESLRPTVFEELSHNGVDWCRYCGTTEGINWRPGPWGKRTLCNKHGCDYKGYGFASKMPRLNLKSFVDEPLEERIRPVLQTFCQICQQDCSEADNILVHCDGCHRAYHQCCHSQGISAANLEFDTRWYCEPSCRDNIRRRRIVVELPKCRLPFMCSPRHNSANSSNVFSVHSGESTPARSSCTSPATALRNTRSRKRKVRSISPDPIQLLNETPVDGFDTGDKKNNTLVESKSLSLEPCLKVRKSSRVARPSFKRLESDYVI